MNERKPIDPETWNDLSASIGKEPALDMTLPEAQIIAEFMQACAKFGLAMRVREPDCYVSFTSDKYDITMNPSMTFAFYNVIACKENRHTNESFKKEVLYPLIAKKLQQEIKDYASRPEVDFEPGQFTGGCSSGSDKG